MKNILSDENAQFTQLLDYYLSDEGKMHLPAINSTLSPAHNYPLCTTFRTVRLVLGIPFLRYLIYKNLLPGNQC